MLDQMKPPMKLSHVIYRGRTLDDAVHKFRELGFHVEYGSKQEPHNALIYFSQGPYIELLANAPLSSFAKLALRVLGKRNVIERLGSWGEGPEGFFEICLENYRDDFRLEKEILDRYGETYFTTKSKRLDEKNRLLKWKLLFPDTLELPFLMTYFNIDPKPAEFVHPNGIKGIKNVSYGTDVEMFPMLEELCDDPILSWFEGRGFGAVEYETV